MKNIGVEFKKNGKIYIFFDNNLDLSVNDYVIVETEKGEQFGRIKSISDISNENEKRSLILRLATDSDIKKHEKNINDAANALIKAQNLANNLNIEMKFIDCYYTFDKKQLIFNFLSDNRVDFRELAKELASIYKTRIELRQVGARDKAKEISGLGQCGRKICCSSFLNDIDSVGIAQVKNQNLSLNPNKINGLCGRLLCCLKYEDDLYTKNRQKLPILGEKIEIDGECGSVIFVDIPNEKYTFLSDNGTKSIFNIDKKYKRCSNARNNN